MKGLVINFPNDTVTVDYVWSSLVKNENYFKSLKHVDNNCKVNAVFSIALANKLKQYADVNIPASVYDNNDTLVFTGYLRKSFTFTKTQRNQPIAIEIVSPSFILDKELTEDIFYTSTQLGTIVNALGSAVDFNLGCTLTETVEYFRAVKGDNVKSTIEQLLFEFGYTYDFNDTGIFVVYNLFNEPTTTNIAHAFSGSDCLEQIQIKRTEKQYTGVTASWKKKEFFENTLLYEDTTGATSSLACSIDVAPLSYMYGNDNNEGKHYLKYDSTKGEVLYCTSITPSLNGTYVETLQTSYENCGDSVLWSAYNPSGVVTAVYHKFQWYGNAWVESSTNESKTTVTGDKSLELTLDYLNSNNAVSAFIAKVANYYRYSLFNLTIKSKVDVSIGSFVTVEDYGIGKITGRVIAKQTTNRNSYTYTIESISEYEPATLEDHKSYVNRQPSDGLASNIAEVNSDLARIYSNHTVTLYKESSTFISETGITSKSTYNFADNSFSFFKTSGANGWSITKPANPTYTLYTTTATATGKDVTDDIEPSEWTAPIAIGQNGVSTRTIQLFQRSDAQPSDLPGDFTQNFYHTGIDATTQQLKGWQTAYPSVEDNTNPVWEIHLTVTSVSNTVLIQPSMWSSPNKIAQDMEVTQAEIQEMVNKAQKLSAPTVYAESTFGSVMVDEDNVALCVQTLSTVVHVLQLDEELDFQFGNVEVPNGFTVTHNKNVLTITIAEGTVVKSNSIKIPIVYYPYVSMDKYGDEDGYVYVDEEGKEYGCYIYSDVATTYYLGFGIEQTKSGRYLKSITSLDSIPSTLFVGDFFTWNGSITTTSISESGSFVPGACYKWNGLIWKKDSSPAHLQTALSDVLTNAKVDLQNNNSEVFGMFQKILANEAILENLVVTGSALINRLQAIDIYADKFTSYDTAAKGYGTDAIDDTLEQLFGEGKIDKTTHTIIEGSKIETGVIDADAIRSGLVETTYLESNYTKTTKLESDYASITYLEGGTGTFKGKVKATQFEVIVGGTAEEVDVLQLHQDALDASSSATSASSSATSASSSATSASSSATSAGQSATAASQSATSAEQSASAATQSASSASESAEDASDSAYKAGTDAMYANTSANRAETAKNDLENGNVTAKNATNVTNGNLGGMVATGTVAFKSSDWVDETSETGFGMMANGDTFFNNGSFRGDIYANNGYFRGDMKNCGIECKKPTLAPFNYTNKTIAQILDEGKIGHWADPVNKAETYADRGGSFWGYAEFHTFDNEGNYTGQILLVYSKDSFSTASLVDYNDNETNSYGYRLCNETNIVNISGYYSIDNSEVRFPLLQLIRKNEESKYKALLNNAIFCDEFGTLRAKKDGISLNNSDLSQNGYMKFPNGLIYQWGYKEPHNDNKITDVYFSISFSTVFNIQISMVSNNNTQNADTHYGSIFNISETGFSIDCNYSFTDKRGVYWFAIGI